MAQGRELEEGKACHYKDDASIDPDVALSYIGDKVQNILGHLQKDFEGEVSSENLGAKFGGYGSFLPVHQHPPPIWLQPRSPQRVQSPQLPRSPDVCPGDPAHLPRMVPEAPSTWRRDLPPPPGMRTSQTLKTPVEDASSTKNASFASDNVPEAFSGKVDNHLGNSGYPPDQKMFKVRIKVGLDRVAHYNAEINNLGLTSPSSSEENSFHESDGLLPQSHDISDESPTSIIQMMTSFPESVGLLLSPLHEGLLNLVRESEKDGPVKNRSGGGKERVKGRTVSGKLVRNNSLEHGYRQHEAGCNSIEKVGKYQARTSQEDVSVKHGRGGWIRGSGNCASFNDNSDTSEGEEVKGAMDDSRLRVNSNDTLNEHEGFGMPHAVNTFSYQGDNKPRRSQSGRNLASKADSLRSGSCVAPVNSYSGKKDVPRPHLSQKTVVQTSSEHMDNPKHLLERSSCNNPKNYGHGISKSKSVCGDKLKVKSQNNEYLNKATSDTHVVDPPDAVAHTKEGTFNGLEQAVVVPVVIEENWVCCDSCETWRLLPYGTTTEQLPEKWVCSMLDCLPGMNRCGISEDETTKAVRALYAVPAPENQHNFQTCANGAVDKVVLPSVHNFGQNHRYSAYDQMKKQKLKAKGNTVSTDDLVLSSGKKHLRQLATRAENSKEVVQSLTRVNAASKFNMQHPNKPAAVSVKSNKRKGDFLIEDPRKIQKRSAQHVEENVQKSKHKDVHSMDNLQTSCGDLGMNDRRLTSGLPNEVYKTDGMKKSAPNDVISRGTSNIQICVEKQKDQMKDLPDKRLFGVKTCSNSRDESTKRIKLKSHADSQPREVTFQNNGNNVQDRKVSIKQDTEDCYFHRDQKSQVSQAKEVFHRGQGHVISERSAEPRIRSMGSKEDQMNRNIQKERVTISRVNQFLTIDDINKLRKDLGCDELSTAVTSSSSMVSDSFRNRIRWMEVKGSPEESVSSHSMLMQYPNPVSPMMMETVQSKFKEEIDVDDNNHASKHKISNNKILHPFSDKSSSKSVKISAIVGKSDVGKSSDSRSEKQPAKREHVKNDVERSVAVNASPGTNNVSGATAYNAWKEAEDVLKKAEEYRSHADFIKNSGFSSESNFAYFKAALEFLHGASLLEACSEESSKQLELTPMQIYGSVAKLCKTCACEYEKGHEMAAAALACKCMEVAYMRVVYCKSTTTHRLWHDLQSSLQMVPQGESPSSSASDVDNLTNLAMVDKVTLSKGSSSHVGNYVILPHNRPKVVRLLDFAKDVNSAMEAAKKTQDTFTAAHLELEESKNKAAIISIRRVIDFSFQNVKELVRSVWLAFDNINHQGLTSTRE